MLGNDGSELGFPRPPSVNELSLSDVQAVDARAADAAPEGAQPPSVKEVNPNDPAAMHDLIMSTARERDARAAAAAPPRDTADRLDGPQPPRGFWSLGGQLCRLAFLDSKPSSERALALECELQAALRPWDDMLKHLQSVVGPFQGLICDLGCGAGVAARHFVEHDDVSVVGFDTDPCMVAAAKARCPSGSFRCLDAARVHVYPELAGAASGVWCSFAAAHFPGKALEKVLTEWAWMLRPGGWLCLTDLEGLFSVHRPFPESRWARDFRQLDDDLQSILKYDAFVAKRLAQTCKKAGLRVLNEREWPGATEYNFEGPANAQQLAAWATRMEREPLKPVLQRYFRDFETEARENFLECLRSREHTTRCKVRMVICQKPAS